MQRANHPEGVAVEQPRPIVEVLAAAFPQGVVAEGHDDDLVHLGPVLDQVIGRFVHHQGRMPQHLQVPVGHGLAERRDGTEPHRVGEQGRALRPPRREWDRRVLGGGFGCADRTERRRGRHVASAGSRQHDDDGDGQQCGKGGARQPSEPLASWERRHREGTFRTGNTTPALAGGSCYCAGRIGALRVTCEASAGSVSSRAPRSRARAGGGCLRPGGGRGAWRGGA